MFKYNIIYFRENHYDVLKVYDLQEEYTSKSNNI